MNEEKAKKNSLKILEENYRTIQIPQSDLDFIHNATEYVRQAVTSPQFIESLRILEDQHRRVSEAFQQMSSRINIDFDKIQAPMLNISNAVKALNIQGMTDAVKRFSESQKLYNKDLLLSSSSIIPSEIKTQVVREEKADNEEISEVLPFLIRSFVSQKDIENDLKKLRSSDRAKVRKIINEVLNEKTEDNLEQLDIQDLKEKLSRFHNFVTQKPLPPENKELKNSSPDNQKELIRSIVFIEKKVIEKSIPKFAYSFYINGNQNEIKLLRGDSNKILQLIKIIKNEEAVPFSNELVTYINFNQKCGLYCAGKYELTRIIEKHGQNLRIALGVEAKVIKERAYKMKANDRKRS